MNERDICIDVLKMEYVQTTGKLHYQEDQANKYVSHVLTATGVFATLLTLLVDEGHVSNNLTFSLLLIAGVTIVGILMIMALHYTVQSFRLGGYVKYLETRINLQANCNLLQWEITIAKKSIHKNVGSYSIYGILCTMFLLLLAIAGYVAVEFIWPHLRFVTCFAIGIILLEGAACIVYLCQVTTVHRKIYGILSVQDNAGVSCSDPHNTEECNVEQEATV